MRLRSSNPFEQPDIDLGLLTEDLDIAILRDIRGPPETSEPSPLESKAWFGNWISNPRSAPCMTCNDQRVKELVVVNG